MEERTYSGHDGTEMLLRVWQPERETTRGHVLGIHGLGSHSGLLSFIAESYTSNGFTFYGPDLRGFGTFSGLKGHVDRFEEYDEDIHSIVHQIREDHPSQPLILHGHSLGALHIILYASKYPDGVDAIIIPCPAVSERLKVSAVTRAMAVLLSKTNVKKQFSNGLDFDLLSRNPDVVSRNRDDPLRHDMVTPRFAVEGLKAREIGFNSGPKLTIPILILQPGDDLITIPEQNKEFFDTIASEDKTWKLYEGLYHEPWEEPGGEVMLHDLFAWLDERFPR